MSSQSVPTFGMKPQKPKDIYIVIGNIHPGTGELKREDSDGVTERDDGGKIGSLDRNGNKGIL
jgi:hypothetical protein